METLRPLFFLEGSDVTVRFGAAEFRGDELPPLTRLPFYNDVELGRGFVFPRIREIVDENGERFRVSVAVDEGGALITLEHPVEPDGLWVVLDPAGAELLGSYLMSARLALPLGLPDESMEQGLVRCFRLVVEPSPHIEVTCGTVGTPFRIPARYWDKLYAELCIVVAHTRNLGRHVTVRIH